MMKQLIIFETLVVVAFGYPTVKTWPFNELYDTINKLPDDDPMKPYLEEGAGMIIGPIFEGKDVVFGHAIIPSPTGAKSWTRVQLLRVGEDAASNPVLRVMVRRALENIKKRNTAIVSVPAVDISTWTPSDVAKYIKNPKTKPELIPYLKKAQREIKKAKGNKKGKVTMVTPINLVPVKSGRNPYPMGYVFQKMTYK